MEDLSYGELQERLSELEQERYSVEQALATKRSARKKELLSAFREQAEAEGFTLAEVIGNRLTTSRSQRSSGDYPTWALREDPNRTYVRGRLPNWMQERMGELGLDPKSKADREQFKQEHMEQV